ncbi:MAG: hypothetical protein OXI97_11290 [Acidimicrobiaceae bacterium]|nr:hypothetical protein [Acidimicrobiaceae bacterium]
MPILPDHVTIHDHYGHAIFARLSTACTSIHKALLAIKHGLYAHAAVASSRRACEALWQAFWLCEPEADGSERIRRLLVSTKGNIDGALRAFSPLVSPEVAVHLQECSLRIDSLCIEQSIDSEKYVARQGREDYEGYFYPRANDPLTAVAPPVPDGVDGGAVSWSMMSNMVHPNVVFDWVFESQRDYQQRINGIQFACVSAAMAEASNLSMTLVQQAQLPPEHVVTVNEAFRGPVYAMGNLIIPDDI